METTFSNRRIAKNAVVLYLRLGVTLLISLYTARLLLANLGVDNYGIYNVVGGIVLIFSSLRGLFSCAVQRFLNYEYAKEEGNANKVFSIAIIIHLALAGLFIILVEIVGLLMIPNMVIPPDRLSAAYTVFHFSVLASAVSIMIIPYDAVIISKEKMGIYAYISIFEALCKLAIVFLIAVLPFDILVNYGLLVLFSTVIVFLIYYIYCRNKFSDARFILQWDRNLFKEMSSFAGWNFAGNLAYSLTNEGLNLSLNFFGGVAVNAARGISYQIKNILQQLFSNIMTAYRPQSTVAFARGEYNHFYTLVFQSSKLVFALFATLCVPLYLFLPEILSLWLGQVPQYTVDITRAILVYLMIRCFHEPIDIVFKSAGKLKHYQLCELFVLTLSLPLSVLILRQSYGYHVVFYVMALVELVNLIMILAIAVHEAMFPLKEYIRKVQIPCACLMICLFFFHYVLSLFVKIPDSAWCSIVCCIIDVILVCLMTYTILLNKQEREIIMAIVKKIFKTK